MRLHKIGSFGTGGGWVRHRGAGRGAEELLSESKSVGPLRDPQAGAGGQRAQPIVGLCFLSTACFFRLKHCFPEGHSPRH